MPTLSSGSITASALLALLVGCSDSLPPELQPSSRNPAFWLEVRGYPNAREAVGLVGAMLSNHTFSVLAHNGTSPVSGAEIVWRVTGSAGWVYSVHDTTRDGVSAPALPLGPDEGKYTVTATAPAVTGATQLAFKATAVTVLIGVRGPVDGGFAPASVTVSRGRSVGWRYDDGGEGDVHTVTFEDDWTRPVSSGDLWNLWSGSLYHARLFDGSPRTVRYRCTYHSTSFTDGEVGTVAVQ